MNNTEKIFTPSLLLFDLDGTLLDSRKRISLKNLAAIEECRRRGIMIGVATARSESTCQRFVNKIHPDLLISSSGAMVRFHGNVVYQCGFSSEETSVIVKAGVAHQRGITVDCADTTYCNRNLSFFNETGMTYTDFSEFARNAYKICIEGTDITFAQRTAALIEECSWLAFSDCDWFKFSKSNVSKGDALLHVAGNTGIMTEKMISFGDDNVDIKMLEICGLGVAMQNAIDEVKQHADIVIGHNDTNAIADFIDQYIL